MAAASTSKLPAALTSNSLLLVTSVPGDYETFKPLDIFSEKLYDDVEVPEYSPWQGLGRQRPIAEEADLSDEAFARRHRFPEVLEKRSKRRERERLVHERHKLKSTVERLRNNDNISSLLPPSTLPTTATSQERAKEAEQARRTLLSEAEETLKRYDELLEPRGPAVVEKSRRKPPANREAPKGPAKAKASLAPTESFTITFKRDVEGHFSASSRATSVVPPIEEPEPRSSKRLRTTNIVYMSEDEEFSDDERPKKRGKRTITDSFFDNELIRDQIFPPVGSKRRASGRVAYAFGVKAPDYLTHPFDFDEVAQDFASSR